MESSLVIWQQNVDSWIKQIMSDQTQILNQTHIIDENVSCIQHNYELIYELKAALDKLTEEVKALKLMQLLMMKKKG